MAIAVTSHILHDGRRNAVIQFTGVSDGSGQETGVVKVDVSELNPPPVTVKIKRIEYDVNGGDVKLSWDADVDVDFAVLSGQNCLDYCNMGGMVNSAEMGKTGDINLSTLGFELNSSYTIKFDLIKKF
jgi:hypothetical protein